MKWWLYRMNSISLAVGSGDAKGSNVKKDIALREETPMVHSLDANLLVRLVCELSLNASPRVMKTRKKPSLSRS